MSAYKKGDRVRVTFEGTVTNVFDLGDDSVELKIEPADNYVQYVSTRTHNVEKIEPEVEVFGPGDVVRLRGSNVVRVLGERGYVRLDNGADYRYGGANGAHRREYFTSKLFERVSVP